MSSQAERALAVFPAGISNGEFALPPALLVVMARGEGRRSWDTDGHEYLDFSMGWSPCAKASGDTPTPEIAFARQSTKGGPPPEAEGVGWRAREDSNL